MVNDDNLIKYSEYGQYQNKFLVQYTLLYDGDWYMEIDVYELDGSGLYFRETGNTYSSSCEDRNYLEGNEIIKVSMLFEDDCITEMIVNPEVEELGYEDGDVSFHFDETFKFEDLLLVFGDISTKAKQIFVTTKMMSL